MITLDDIAATPQEAQKLSRDDVVTLYLRLWLVHGILMARLVAPEPPKEEGRLITKAEAIRRMKAAGIPASDSTWHREKHRYASFIVPREISGGRVMCSEAALERYIRESGR